METEGKHKNIYVKRTLKLWVDFIKYCVNLISTSGALIGINK
jgi:hypothetical protein